MNIFDILTMIGGLCLFLFGMSVMGDALERRAGNGLKSLLAKLTQSKPKGFFTGLGVTAVVQSSSATTVMVVGFVNSGIMTLKQAVNVIMGANIGTTVTAHIVSLSGVGSIDIGAIAAVLGCIGVLMAMLVKNEKVVNIGNILGGLGLIFVGLEFISTYAKAIMFISEGVPHGWVKSIFQGDHNPILLVFIGMIIGSMLGLLGIISVDSVGVIEYLFGANLQMKEDMVLFSSTDEATELIDVCVNGNGNIENKLNLDKMKEPLNQIYNLSKYMNESYAIINNYN